MVLGVALAVGVAACGGADPASDARSASGSETEVVVSMGDSYIAGTAGRWRGNTNGLTNLPPDLVAYGRADTGADAYDNFGLEFPGEQCFRSRSAAIHLGGRWTSINVACSNATTFSRVDETGRYKPGIDAGGQLDLLADIARRDTVRLVAVSIGANDFRFGPVMTECATGFLTSLAVLSDRCSDDTAIRSTIAPESVDRVRGAIAGSLAGIVSTLRAAGYADDAWALVTHTYPSPLPPSSAMRYGQSGFERQVTGGCPFYDADLDWLSGWMSTLNATVTAAARQASADTGKSVAVVEMGGLFEGRRLCEQGTRLVEETADDAELRAFGERVDMIRLSSRIPGSPYDITEGVHPNQLGQSAIRACLRAAFADGAARSGTCRPPTDWAPIGKVRNYSRG
ncbi:MAG: hypothetical protein ACKOIA_02990, partial [Acidimicrobiia bacterium]